MCIIDGNVDCIIDPISNAIYNVIYPFFAWIFDAIYGVFAFMYSIGVLLVTIITLITGVFGDIYAVNPYAATALGLLISGVSLIIFLRIYNIIAGIEIWGFKLPRL